MGTPTGRLATVAALAGYPVGTAPLGYARFSGRAFGVCFVARANQEALILSAMSAWEATFPKREPPPALAQEGAKQSENLGPPLTPGGGVQAKV